MRLIHPSNWYDVAAWPDIPDCIEDAKNDLLSRVADLHGSNGEKAAVYERWLADLSGCIDLLRLAVLKNGARRNETGVNRAAQHRWPERKWNSDKVRPVLNAWTIAGMQSLLELIIEPRRRNGAYRGPSRLVNQAAWVGLRAWIAREVPLNDAGAPMVTADNVWELTRTDDIFATPRLCIAQAESPDRPVHKIYTVRSETKFGNYHFLTADTEPPDAETVAALSIHHNHADRVQEVVL